MGRRAHTHPDAGELVCAQVGDDIFQAVVAPGAAAGADAELAQGQGHVVGDDQHSLRRDLVEAAGQLDRLAAQVHIGLGLEHQHPLALDGDLAGEGPVAELAEPRPLPAGEPVSGHKADVVAGVLIVLARIAQAHQQPLVGGHCVFPFSAVDRRFYRDLLVKKVPIGHFFDRTDWRGCIRSTAWRQRSPGRSARWPPRTWGPR